AVLVFRHIAHVHIISQSVVFPVAGGGGAGVEGLVGVISFDVAFHDGVRYHGNAVVADHAPVYVCIVAPHGQHFVHALVVVFQHGAHHVRIALRLNDVEEGMQGAIGVPEGEGGVVGKTFGAVVQLIQPAVATVHVHIG